MTSLQNNREQRGPSYLTLTPRLASRNPKYVFSSSRWLSWWNICSVVNGVIVASRSWGVITVKFIDLCSWMAWFIFTVQQCECVSVKVVAIAPSFHLALFFPPVHEQFICVAAEVSRVFVRHFVCGCGSQTLNNDPHSSLHAPLTEKNKNATSLLEKKWERGKKNPLLLRVRANVENGCW